MKHVDQNVNIEQFFIQ